MPWPPNSMSADEKYVSAKPVGTRVARSLLGIRTTGGIVGYGVYVVAAGCQ